MDYRSWRAGSVPQMGGPGVLNKQADGVRRTSQKQCVSCVAPKTIRWSRQRGMAKRSLAL
jgi:hypothetical protein